MIYFKFLKRTRIKELANLQNLLKNRYIFKIIVCVIMMSSVIIKRNLNLTNQCWPFP